MKFHRIDIKSAEIAMIMNVSNSTARAYMRMMKSVYNKKKHHIITIAEFCDYFNYPYKTIFCQINNINFKDYDILIAEGYVEDPKLLFIDQSSDS